MRILRIKLRNFRGVAECEVRFPREGISIVAGDNEVGKSSIAMAIDALIEHLDSSKKQEVLALKPVHRDEGAEVEADIEAGPYQFTYFKRFHRQAQTNLTIRSPRAENLSGREAHERVSEILRETVDMALWKALRIEQGSELLPPDLSAQKRLSAALDAAAGSAKAGEGDESLYDAAHAEMLRYFTDGGSERKDFRQRGEESNAAAQAAAEMRQRLTELGKDIESSESLEQQLTKDEPELVRLRKVATERQQAVFALTELDSAVATAEAKLEAARKQLGIAEEQARQRAELRSDVDARQRAQDDAQDEFERERSLGSSDAASSDQATRAVAEALAARDAAEGRLTLARKDLRFRQSEHDLALLSERLARVERAQVKLARADQMLEGPRVQDDDLKALRSAGEEVAKAKAVLQTESPRLRLAAQRKLSIELDGERREVAPGASIEAQFS
ncbi:MAG: AAA family ATPase [Planctomycetota bacterium]